MGDIDQDSEDFEQDEELREMVERALRQSLVEKKTFKKRQDLAKRRC